MIQHAAAALCHTFRNDGWTPAYMLLMGHSEDLFECPISMSACERWVGVSMGVRKWMDRAEIC